MTVRSAVWKRPWSEPVLGEQSRCQAEADAAALGLELVVALAFELEEAEAVAEGIVQERDSAVWLLSRSCLDNGAGSPRSSNSCVEVSDDEVQVEWRPMSSVGAKLRRPFEGLATRHF